MRTPRNRTRTRCERKNKNAGADGEVEPRSVQERQRTLRTRLLSVAWIPVHALSSTVASVSRTGGGGALMGERRHRYYITHPCHHRQPAAARAATSVSLYTTLSCIKHCDQPILAERLAHPPALGQNARVWRFALAARP